MGTKKYEMSSKMPKKTRPKLSFCVSENVPF